MKIIIFFILILSNIQLKANNTVYKRSNSNANTFFKKQYNDWYNSKISIHTQLNYDFNTFLHGYGLTYQYVKNCNHCKRGFFSDFHSYKSLGLTIFPDIVDMGISFNHSRSFGSPLIYKNRIGLYFLVGADINYFSFENSNNINLKPELGFLFHFGHINLLSFTLSGMYGYDVSIIDENYTPNRNSLEVFGGISINLSKLFMKKKRMIDLMPKPNKNKKAKLDIENL